MNTALRLTGRGALALAGALMLTGCQYFADRSNDLHDMFVGGWSRSGGVLLPSVMADDYDDSDWGRGGGLEIGLKATEFLWLDFGASEMRSTEYGNAPLMQMIFGAFSRLGEDDLLGEADRPDVLQRQEFWEQSLGFPFAMIYTGVAGQLPEPTVARRAVQGRMYMHTVLREHDDGDYDPWFISRGRASRPIEGEEVTLDFMMGMNRWEGLNSYMFISPYLDSAKPVIDRFELGGEINLHFIGLHLGLSLGQVADFLLGFTTLDIADDDGRMWYMKALTGQASRVTSPYSDPPPLQREQREN